MLYKKYQLFDKAIEMMIPKNLIETEDIFRDYVWMSADRKIVVTVTKGIQDMTQQQLLLRLQDFYLEYQSAVTGFRCIYVKKHTIHQVDYGEMMYESEIMGYVIQNIILLGSYQNSELIITLQCGKQNEEEQLHIFSNIIESIKMKPEDRRNWDRQEEGKL